jgi:hypothetical protein
MDFRRSGWWTFPTIQVLYSSATSLTPWPHSEFYITPPLPTTVSLLLLVPPPHIPQRLYSPQDASLIRLPRAYAPYVQSGLQEYDQPQVRTIWDRRTELHFIDHGPVKMSTYLINYRVGDIVDIKANSAQQRGMPHKYYHG